MKQENMLYQKIVRDITKDLEGTYLTLPFEVPKGIQEVKVHLQVLGNDENVIDLGLEDTKQVRGWSGGARRTIFVREDRATPGYIIDSIKAGTWGVILNAYRISTDCTIQVEIMLEKETPEWIKGDTHMHSNHSDSPYSLSEMITNAKEAGLSYIALTDHNTFSQNEAFEPREDLIIIPAVELTTNRGHCNFYGVLRPFTDFRCETIADVQQAITEGLENNALVSVNHPHCDYCWWDWGLENFTFEFAEIWNGPWKQSNQKTLDWWQSQLAAGQRIIAIGGSDKHGPDPYIQYGQPTTAVEASVKSPQGILEGISKGRAAILANPHETIIDLAIAEKNMGETIRLTDDTEWVDLRISSQQPITGYLKIYTSDGLIHDKIVKQQKQQLVVSVKANTLFYRAELWEEDQSQPKVITNPIFVEYSK
ncbi:CehA/McbA family metallohydrolase [Gracilibacillus alcaliphilus]|uniref:CehA/McbA family metallohydrolase n=1 Tax=Gracilibacillus alcaliphilus TaxID=1401441 RepID=UPI00195806E6|nr:CehA/McbA family metallohydrolase [Gracilibacillus alcaliphilus]MBM7676748.1 hypothetical protein [Gracilibacillus alcaliphilus]